MADIHVSTFSALCDALTNADNDDIYIDRDMDATNDPITSKIVVGSCNVHGQGHTIYNITNTESNAVACFEVGPTKSCTWEDTNFYNIYHTNNGSFLAAIWDGTSTSLNVQHCNFQGKWNSLFKRGTYEYCSIVGEGSLSIYASNIPADRVVYNALYVDIKCKVTSGSTRYGGYMTNAVNCFFTGEIDVSDLTTDVGFLAATTFTPTNCIYNMDIKSNTPKTLKWGNSSTFAPIDICLFNTSKIQNVTLSQTHSSFIGLTDSELKNRDSVAATGFPII